MSTTLAPQNPLSYMGVKPPNPPNVITDNRAPTTLDTNYDLGTMWVDYTVPQVYFLALVNGNTATWLPLGGGSTDVQTLTGNSGGMVFPTLGNIDILGDAASGMDVVGNPGLSRLTIFNTLGTGRFPITPYVVGPIGKAGYQTIQDGLDAANAAGGGVVYIQPGAYAENLTLYDGVHLYGTPAVSQNQGASVSITGTHTPPATGQVAFNSICWISTTDVFSSVAAGSTHLAFLNCESAVQNGYFLNLPNWTGTLEIYDNNPSTAGAPFAINDGGINNTGGATLLVFSSGVGSGTNVMNLSGPVICQDMSFGCPVNFQTGSNIACEFAIFEATVTCSNNSTGFFRSCHFSPSTSVPALTMSSSAPIELSSCVVDTPNVPAIDGAGAGTLSYGNIVFVDDTTFAGTLTLSPLNCQPYSTAGTPVTAVRGTAGFDSTDFIVTDGFVQLAASSGFIWNEVVSLGPTSMVANNGYVANNAGLVALTLPLTAAFGTVIRVAGKGAGGWLIAQNAGQTIHFGSSDTTPGVGGSLASTLQYDSVELLCTVADTEWTVLSVIGNLTVV